MSVDGRVAAGIVSGAEAISELVTDVLNQAHPNGHPRMPAEALP